MLSSATRPTIVTRLLTLSYQDELQEPTPGQPLTCLRPEMDRSKLPQLWGAPELGPKAAAHPLQLPNRLQHAGCPSPPAPLPAPLRLPDPSASLSVLFPAPAQTTFGAHPGRPAPSPGGCAKISRRLDGWQFWGGPPESLDRDQGGAVEAAQPQGNGRRCRDRRWGSQAAAGRPQSCSGRLELSQPASPAPLGPRPLSGPAQCARREPRMRASAGAGQVAGGSEWAALGGVRGSGGPGLAPDVQPRRPLPARGG